MQLKLAFSAIVGMSSLHVKADIEKKNLSDIVNGLHAGFLDFFYVTIITFLFPFFPFSVLAILIPPKAVGFLSL